jgi:O-antigen/teichoic acid export membrane protein
MSRALASSAGTALLWKAVQLFGAKLIFLVRLLVLSYLLGPEEFGLIAIALAAIGFLLAVTDFGMSAALVQHGENGNDHFHVAWSVGVIRALAIAIGVFAAAPLIAALFDESRAVDLLRVLCLVPVLDALASIKTAELARRLDFRPLAVIGLGQALANTVAAVGLAHMIGVWALVVGALTGSATQLVLSYFVAPYRPRLLLDARALQPLIRFGRWIFLTGLIAELGGMLLKVVIARRLSTADLGLYYLAASIATLPAQAASELIGTVAFPLYARLQTDLRRLTLAFRTILTGMGMLLLPVSALLIALAPTLVETVFDARWTGSGPIIQIILLSGIIGLLGEATVPLLKGVGQPYRIAVLEVIQSALIIVLVWGLTGRFGLVGAALAMLLSVAASQGVSVLFVKRLLDRPFGGLTARAATLFGSALGSAAVALALVRLPWGVTGLAVAATAGAAVGAGILWCADRRFELGLIQDFTRAFPQVAVLFGLSARKDESQPRESQTV